MPELNSTIVANIQTLALFQILALGLVFAFVLSFVVKKYSQLVGQRSQYLLLFTALIPTVILVISVVKSSLALSLGLVGALSIVRFRTPVKEPEELAYIFIAISVGIGLGADQVAATSVCFTFIMLTLVTIGIFRKQYQPSGVYFDIDGDISPTGKNLQSIEEAFTQEKVHFDLRRYSEVDNNFSSTYFIETVAEDSLQKIITHIRSLDCKNTVSIIKKSRQLG